MPGSTAQTNKYHTFYLQQRQDGQDTWADIKVNHPLDYETIKEYNLTIRVEVSEMLNGKNNFLYSFSFGHFVGYNHYNLLLHEVMFDLLLVGLRRRGILQEN